MKKVTKQQQALLRAVQNDDLKKVKALLGAGVKPDFPGKKTKTPLQEAIRGGNIGIVRALVKAGANVNALNANGDKPLDVAYAKGEGAIITYLRGKGAREASDNYGYAFNGASRTAASSKSARNAKTPAKKKTKGGSKKPARFQIDDDWEDPDAFRGTGGRNPYWGNGWDDEDDEKPAREKPAPKKNEDPNKPHFTAETLKDVFNAQSWIGKTREMAELWRQVPARLKKKFDFEAAYAEAQQETLRRHHPKNLSLKPRPAEKDETPKQAPPPPPPAP